MSSESVIKIAKLIIQKERITAFPIDINKISKKYANIKYINLPFNFDGITLKERKKHPQIIINTNRNSERQRFTLAHELGHIVIPWHVGIIVDKNILNENHYEDHEYKDMEAEANLFASEILLPTELIIDYISKELNSNTNNIGLFIEKLAKKSQVSLIATTLKVFKYLPSNYMYVITNNDNTVLYSGRSTGTLPNKPTEGEIIDLNSFFSHNCIKNMINTFSNQFIYVFFPRNIEVTKSDNTDWRSLLSSIINETFTDENEIKHIYTSVNSRIGALYGGNLSRKKIDFNIFYHSILERIQGYDDLEWLLNHKNFMEFLLRKATDLYNKYLLKI